ncbi:hypothetical protein L596_015328 [Steinernema carpocapsae]|uniref:Uncharacterized protein n=1 Tax=Steinernema carpocapsae TaxID=34508 RepID=A0A4U5NF93_STECR|nr:hypothetical protein L596_015328 [Steinernema carpocapsae]
MGPANFAWQLAHGGTVPHYEQNHPGSIYKQRLLNPDILWAECDSKDEGRQRSYGIYLRAVFNLCFCVWNMKRWSDELERRLKASLDGNLHGLHILVLPL